MTRHPFSTISLLFVSLTVIFSSCSCAKLPIDPAINNAQIYRPADTVYFAAIGDFGTDSKSEADVAAMVKSWNPEFIITTGDNNYPIGSAGSIVSNIGKHYCDFIYNPDAPSDRICNGKSAQEKVNRFLPCPGNHDNYALPQLKAYLDYFTLPGNERDYDFIWGPVHFFSINTNANGKPDAGIKEWLQEKLSKSQAPFKVVYFHHPPYSVSNHGSNESMQWPFHEWGVDAVLCGHDHVYEKIKDKQHPSPIYMVIGNSGNQSLYGCNSKPIDTSRFEVTCDNQNFGALKIRATTGKMVIEYFTIANQSSPADVYIIEK